MNVAEFDNYTKPYLDHADVAKEVSLKIDHSKTVAKHAGAIAASLNSDPETSYTIDGMNFVEVAELTGLYHDIGRFEQLRRFGTFSDRHSVDHGDLGAEILEQENMLSWLPRKTRSQIVPAVKNHNKYQIAEEIQGTALTLSQIVRDADKIDIYRIAILNYQKAAEAGTEKSAVSHHLPRNRAVSAHIVSAFCKGKPVLYKELESEADFMVLNMAWIFELHFNYTRRFVLNNGYIDQLYCLLPESCEKQTIGEKLKETYTLFLQPQGSRQVSQIP